MPTGLFCAALPRVLRATLAAAVAAFALRRLLACVEVRGESMRPALGEGDRVLVVRVAPELIPRGAFVVGRMPREAAPPVLDAAREHLRDQYVRGKQFVKVLGAKPGDYVDGGAGAPRELAKHSYWVEPVDPDAAGSRQWGPVHRDLIWGWAPLRGRLRIKGGAVATDSLRTQDEPRVAGGHRRGDT